MQQQQDHQQQEPAAFGILFSVVVAAAAAAPGSSSSSSDPAGDAASGEHKLSGCIQHVAETQGQGMRTAYELLMVDARGMRGWRTRFTTQDVNNALQDEELEAPDLDQVLAAVLRCDAALATHLQADGRLQLAGWCHRTLRVPLLPPPLEQHEQQHQPDSEFRQEAFCLRLPVTAEWMEAQHGAEFAAISAGLLDFMQQHSQQQQAATLQLHGQLQLLAAHTSQLHAVTDKATRLLAKSAPAKLLKELEKAGRLSPHASQHAAQQLQEASQLLRPLLLPAPLQQQHQRAGSGRMARPPPPAAAPPPPSAAAAAPPRARRVIQVELPPSVQALVSGMQLPLPPASTHPWTPSQQLPDSQAAPGAATLTPADAEALQQRARLGVSSAIIATMRGQVAIAQQARHAIPGGGKSQVVRQAQDDRMLAQVLTDHPALLQDWQQLALQLGQQPAPLQLEQHATQWRSQHEQQQHPGRAMSGQHNHTDATAAAAAAAGDALASQAQQAAEAAALGSEASDGNGRGGDGGGGDGAAGGAGLGDAGADAALMVPAKTRQVKRRGPPVAAAAGPNKRSALLGRGR